MNLYESITKNIKESSNNDIKETTPEFNGQHDIVDSYYHFTNDLGKLPTIDDIYNDLIHNYTGFNNLNATPEDDYILFKNIESILNQHNLEYKESEEKELKDLKKEKIDLEDKLNNSNIKSEERTETHNDLNDVKRKISQLENKESLTECSPEKVIEGSGLETNFDNFCDENHEEISNAYNKVMANNLNISVEDFISRDETIDTKLWNQVARDMFEDNK